MKVRFYRANAQRGLTLLRVWRAHLQPHAQHRRNGPC